MADAVWPLTIRPQRQSFWLATRTTQFDNPFFGTTQRVEWQGTRWHSEIALRRAGPVTRAIDAFIASLNGPVGTVLLPDFRRLAAKGDLGTPMLTGSTATTLAVADLAGPVLPGTLVQTAPGRGHMVTVRVEPGASAALPIAPPLREPAITGPLITTAVRVRMRLVDDDQNANPTSHWRRTEWRLAFEEVLT